jgi:hypothetical protein
MFFSLIFYFFELFSIFQILNLIQKKKDLQQKSSDLRFFNYFNVHFISLPQSFAGSRALTLTSRKKSKQQQKEQSRLNFFCGKEQAKIVKNKERDLLLDEDTQAAPTSVSLVPCSLFSHSKHFE